MRRVVITGMGLVTPLGLGLEDNWQSLSKGVSGISKLPFDESHYPNAAVSVAGNVTGFTASDWLTRQEARRYDPFIQYALAATQMAVESAKLDCETIVRERAGVCIGSGMGGGDLIEKIVINYFMKGKHPSPFSVAGIIINMAAGIISIKYGLKGPQFATATACSSGGHAVAMGLRTIQYGDADVMFAGGAEAAINITSIESFHAARALSINPDPVKACRPWDKARDGFVMASGSGVLILEELEHAKRRNAPIFAEVIGVGMSGDACHITQPTPDGEGAAQCIRQALKNANLPASELGYINAHGTSTPLGDMAEAKAIRLVFGRNPKQLKVSSTKSMTGHTLGAAGAIEAIFSILSLQNQFAPPTVNLEDPDDGIELDLVPLVGQAHAFEYAMSNSFGFGGTNCSLIFRKV